MNKLPLISDPIFNYCLAYNAACEAAAEGLLKKHGIRILQFEQISIELPKYCDLCPKDSSYLRDKYLNRMTQFQIAERDNYDERTVYKIIQKELKSFVYYVVKNSSFFINVRNAIDGALLPLVLEDLKRSSESAEPDYHFDYLMTWSLYNH